MEHEPSSERGQIAVIVAVFALGLCVLLLVGVVGSLIYAASVKVSNLGLASDVKALREQVADLEAQQAERDRLHEEQVAGLVADLQSMPGQRNRPQSPVVQTPPRAPIPTPRITPTQPTPPPVSKTELFSVATWVAPEPPAKPALPFPEPVAVDTRPGELSMHESNGVRYARYELAYKPQSPQQARSREYSPMVFDEAYRHAYLVDGDTVLRRLDLDTLYEERKLELGAACSELALSKTHLLAALHHHGAIWGIDPDTLEVKYETPLRGARLVASSPKLSMGFAVGQDEVIAFDTETGAVVHRLSLGDRDAMDREMGDRINANLYSFRASPDGQYLYTANRHLHRFRIHGQQLVYEQSSESLKNGHTSQMCMSRDGRWVALPTGGGLIQGGYAIPFFLGEALDTRVLVVQTGAYPGEIDWDLTTGRIYAHDHDSMKVFSPRGRLELTLKRIRGSDVYQIAALPIGDRFLLWTDGNIAIWDLQPDRMSQLLQPGQ